MSYSGFVDAKRELAVMENSREGPVLHPAGLLEVELPGSQGAGTHSIIAKKLQQLPVEPDMSEDFLGEVDPSPGFFNRLQFGNGTLQIPGGSSCEVAGKLSLPIRQWVRICALRWAGQSESKQNQ